MTSIVLWNEPVFAGTLSQLPGNKEIITNKETLNEVLPNWQQFDALIVLCELTWRIDGMTANMQELYGIALVKHFRRTHHINLPVFFVSLLPLASVFTPEKEIVTAIGHRFCQLPQLSSAFTGLSSNWPQKLSVMELNDITSFYCNREGMLVHELHYLNRYLNYNITPDNHNEVYADLCTTLKKIHELFFQDASHGLDVFTGLFPAISRQTIGAAINHIIDVGHAMRSRYHHRPDWPGHHPTSAPSYNWQVLLLDDEIDEDHPLVQHMKARGIHITCVRRAQEAISLLQHDWRTSNSIMVVIADYRLYEIIDGIKHHQPVQGYQFLKIIASSDHLVRLVAFSGLQRKFLLDSFKHYNIRTEVKSKNDYLSGDHTYRLFADEIIDMGEENYETIEALPLTCAGFEKYLFEAYKEFRSHPDYLMMENLVSITATEYVHQLRGQLQQEEEPNMPAIDNIKSPFSKPKKGKGPFFQKLQNYFVARRIALWLYAASKKNRIKPLDARRIAEILTAQKYPTDAYRQILSTNLGLSLDDFPRNITIEERRWLHYDMELDVLKDIQLVDRAFQKIGKYFADFILATPSLCSAIKGNNYVMTVNYKNTDYSVKFNDNFIPVLRTPADVRVLYHILDNTTQHE